MSNSEYACPATPRFFTTAALDYDFDANAGQPAEWLRFLHELWPDDPQSIATLQEWFGYCLMLDTRQQKCLMIVGPTRSGKGTIAKVLGLLVGKQNISGPSLSDLGGRFGLEPLLDKSLAIIPTTRLGGRRGSTVAIDRLLGILREDPLLVDRKHATAIQTRLNTRIMLSSDVLPRFSAVSEALEERMVILRLSRSWLGREDPGLLEKLVPEVPGILLWAIAGWQRLHACPQRCLGGRHQAQA